MLVFLYTFVRNRDSLGLGLAKLIFLLTLFYKLFVKPLTTDLEYFRVRPGRGPCGYR